MGMNEKGVFYPIVLLFVVLFSFVIVIQADFLIREKRVLKLSSQLLQQEYYFKRTIIYLDNHYQLTGEIPLEGRFSFNEGTVYYDAAYEEADLIKLQLTAQVSGVENISAITYYSLSEENIVKWIEIEKQ